MNSNIYLEYRIFNLIGHFEFFNILVVLLKVVEFVCLCTLLIAHQQFLLILASHGVYVSIIPL